MLFLNKGSLFENKAGLLKKKKQIIVEERILLYICHEIEDKFYKTHRPYKTYGLIGN